MKIALSLLVSFAVFQAQSFAISGGPDWSQGGFQGSVTGTYGGTLTPTSTVGLSTGSGSSSSSSVGSNSLGIFTIGVPTTGPATGGVFIFQEGSFFQGGIAAMADPGKGTISGIINTVRVFAISQSTSGTNGSISLAYDATAAGSLKTKLTGGSTQFGTAAIRLDGDATVEVKELDFTTFEWVSRGEITYVVDGFKQSTEVNTNAGDIANLLLNN